MKPYYVSQLSALAIATAAMPAYAQVQDPANPATPNQTPASARTGAPDAVANTSDDSGQLADIVVTAQRRTERAQEVPISIAVVGGESLQQTGARGIQDISQLVPSVQFDPNNGGGFNIRGIGTQVYEQSAERAVSIVLDDVVQDLPRDLGINGLADIERIEVLRGPQGIQFGKNATAGVISVITKRPSLTESSGEFLAEYGERNDRKFTVSGNVPLSDTVAVRVSGYNQGENGIGRYTVLDKRLGDYKAYGVRAKLLWEPSDRLNFLLIGDANHSDDNGLATGASVVSASPAFVSLIGAAGATVGPNNRDSASDVEGSLISDNKGASLTGTLRLGEHTLTSVTAYRDVHITGNSPAEPDPVSRLLPINTPDLRGNKSSQEFRLASPSTGVISYVIGAFYNRLHSNNGQAQAGKLGLLLPPDVFASITNGIQTVDATNKSIAGFGTMNIRPIKWFELVLGGRVTHDKVDYRVGFSPATCQTLGGLPFCVSPDVPYTFVPVSAVPAALSGNAKKTNFSYRVAPTFKLSRDLMVFGSYSTGYKGPGVTTTAGQTYSFDEETVKNYEVGIKSELLDRRLRFNATAFYSKFSNFQTQQQVQGAIGFITANAGGLRSRGVETEVTLRATRAITLNGGMTYADTEFTDYQITTTRNLRGLPPTNAPKWAYNVGASIDVPLTAGLSLTGNTNFSHRTRTFQIAGDSNSVQRGYGLLSARFGVGPEDGSWKVGIYGRNLTNQYFTTAYYDYLSFGFPVQYRQTSPEAGRTIGGFLNLRL